MALQIKCTGTEWKDHVKGNFAALQVGEEILYYDLQHEGDKDFVRKLAQDFRLKIAETRGPTLFRSQKKMQFDLTEFVKLATAVLGLIVGLLTFKRRMQRRSKKVPF